VTIPRRDAVLLVALWSAATAIALAVRPPISPDETRYLGVAWDMWSRGDFLVPHLNGAPYSDKPPLLFWLFHLGWALGGVSETWPRLIGPLFALASAFLLIPMARRLWPDRPVAGWAATLALPGTLGWTIYGSFVLFDMLLTVGVLVALIGVLDVWRGRGLRGWLLCGVGLGWALLSKGPVALLHVLPVPLLAPLWMREGRPARWGAWYAGVGLAFLVGVTMVLAWAVPAGLAGGQAYRDAIFLRQTADRMVSGAAHGRPVWWYLPVIPLLLLPWVLWPAAWRAVASTRRLTTESSVRLCLTWGTVVLIAFALISGKQAHYLLPAVPVLALLWDRGWAAVRDEGRGLSLLLPASFLAVTGIAAGLAPHLPGLERQVPWIGGIRLGPAVLLVMSAGAVALAGPRIPRTRLPLLVTAAGLTLTALLHMAVMPALRPSFDVTPVALELRHYQQDGYDIAHVGKYNAQWHFAARLTEPFAVVADTADARRWQADHPRSVMISYARTGQAAAREAAGQRCSPFRDRLVCLAVADSAKGP
jgi:4-amino-4-deoxy-L-arabinose transferase-like glycosyltransferase